ncbi:MAG: D-serine ammonia-lyase, partial [Bacillota bacterium]|nr:D-serine ammonia-lyase [Bacillota bacterium]
MILGKSIELWQKEYPLLTEIINTNQVFWLNPDYKKYNDAYKKNRFTENDVKSAEKRLKRFA